MAGKTRRDDGADRRRNQGERRGIRHRFGALRHPWRGKLHLHGAIVHRLTSLVVVTFAFLLIAARPATKPTIDPDHKLVKGPGNRFQITIPTTWNAKPVSGDPNDLGLEAPSTQPDQQ